MTSTKLALVVLLLCSGLKEAAAQKTVRRIATLAPPGTVWMDVLLRAAKEVEKHTGIKVKIYPSGVQGTEKTVVRKMRLGQLDGAALTSVGLSMIEKSIRVLELPMMYDSLRQMYCVRARMWPLMRQRFLAKGFRLGEPGDVGYVYLFSKNRIDSRESMKKAVFWLWADDPLSRWMFKAMGVNGRPLGVHQVRPALATGKIDAFHAPAIAALTFQWYTYARYVSAVPVSYAVGAGVLRNEIYDEATPEQKRLAETLGRRYARRTRTLVRRQGRKAMAAMSGRLTRVKPTPELVAELQLAAKKLWTAMIGKLYSRKDLDLVLAHKRACPK